MSVFLEQIAARSLDEAIFRTVAFFDVLDFCLTDEEIYARLLGFQASRQEVFETLLWCDLIENTDGYYHLKGRNGLVGLRLGSETCHEILHKKMDRYRWIFSWIPFLESVYLCNTLAMTQGRAGSDIDVFVVARRGRMFLTRTLLLFATQVLGLRRHGRYVEGRLCLSFFVDEDCLNLEELLLKPCDPYFAYWLLLLKPLYARNDIDVYVQNSWIYDYFSNSRLLHQHVEVNSCNLVCRFFEYVLGGSFGNFIERILMKWQLERATKKYRLLGSPDGVILTSGCLKFHDRDMRKIYLDAWEKRIK